MMDEKILKSYCNRLKIPEVQGNSLKTLKFLVTHHTRRIPFENLNPLLRIPVKLDSENLIQKLIFDKRGGYCFEQNLLFKEILEFLGFEVKPLAARVHSASGEHARTHMMLLVTTENSRFLIDVGFGGMTPSIPLEFKPGISQVSPHGTYRIIQEKELFTLEFLKKEGFQSLYDFDLQEQKTVDYLMANWFTSTFPSSHFRHRLLVARTDENHRYGLRNNELNIHSENGSEKRVLTSVPEIRSVLTEIFGLNLENLPALDEKLGELMEED